MMVLTACRVTSGAGDASPDVPLDVTRASIDAPVDAPVYDARAPEDRPGDQPRVDAPEVLDAGTTEVSVADAPDAALDDPCAPGRVIDLETVGVRSGATTRVTGSNRSTGRFSTLDAPCAAGMVGYTVVYRFTPRARGRLRITTNLAETDARLDTVVFAARACAPRAPSLGCGDDTGDPPRDHASLFVTDEDVNPGEPVYIAVGGFRHATAELWDSVGTFALSVTELALE